MQLQFSVAMHTQAPSTRPIQLTVISHSDCSFPLFAFICLLLFSP